MYFLRKFVFEPGLGSGAYKVSRQLFKTQSGRFWTLIFFIVFVFFGGRGKIESWICSCVFGGSE